MVTFTSNTLMAMKIIFILFCLSQNLWASSWSEEIQHKYPKEHEEIIQLLTEEEELDVEKYPQDLKQIYFDHYSKIAQDFVKTGVLNPDHQTLRNILENLEFKEEETEKTSEGIIAYQKELEKRVFRNDLFLGLQFISWQREVSLNSATDNNQIVVTNRALCLGGGVTRSNASYFYGIDSCAFLGSGDTKEKNSPPNYKESNIPNWGIKTSLQAGIVTSSTGAKLGPKLSSFFNNQKLQNAANSGYRLKPEEKNLFLASLFIKVPLKKLAVQTEIGTFLDQDSTYFSLGGDWNF